MREKTTLLLCTVIHFLVDLTCIYFMNGVLYVRAGTTDQFLAWSVFYNMMAFAFPALVGYLADRLIQKQNDLALSAAGCFLTGCGYFFFRIPVLMILLIGLGNGMFHVGAGIEVLRDSGERYASPGIFIASGALGVFFGTVWGREFRPLWNLFVVLMFLSSAVLLLWNFRKRRFAQEEKGARERGPVPLSAAIPVAGIFLVVLIRSYYGGLMNYSWKKGFAISLVFSICIAGGKFFGGILADRIGLKRAVWISLGMAGLLAVFSFESPVCGCASIFFFNMTMPLTLSLLARLLPGYPGFAFGFLMLALFLGTLPGMLGGIFLGFSPAGLLLMCTVSLVILLWEERRASC